VNANELGDARYLSLTTFKRDGTAVSTPVWVAGEDGRLLVWSAADTWKVKRIRRDAHVRVAPCSATGKPRGEAIEAQATIVPETARIEELLQRKYGLVYRLVHGYGVAARAVRRKSETGSVTIEIVPS
jgi:hypothetical protein